MHLSEITFGQEVSQHIKEVETHTMDNLTVRIWKGDATPEKLFPIITKERAEGKISILLYTDQWERKGKLIQSMLQHHLGNNRRIYARKTELKRIADHTFKDFARRNQLYFPLLGRVNYGIYYNGKIVGAVSFGKIITKKNRKTSAELLQFIVAGGYSITGGLSKVIKKYLTRHQVDEIMTYCMMDWSNGKSFEKVGFRPHSCSLPIECHVNYVKEVISLAADPLLETTFRGPRIKMIYDVH